jgi:hypothetical protein
MTVFYVPTDQEQKEWSLSFVAIHNHTLSKTVSSLVNPQIDWPETLAYMHTCGDKIIAKATACTKYQHIRL